jgi:hypothetical protein
MSVVNMPLTIVQRKVLLSESLVLKLIIFKKKKRKRNVVHQIYKDRLAFG